MGTGHQTLRLANHPHGRCHRTITGQAGAAQPAEEHSDYFASDNGAAIQAPIKVLNCNAGFKGRKGMLYEGGIRVPFIVNQPGKVPVQTLDNIIYFPDVMPTLAALAEGTEFLPEYINGINILPLFHGKQIDTDNRLLYWEFPGKQRAARKGDWKCVTIKPNQPLELYNLKEDPEETTNLADKYPEW